MITGKSAIPSAATWNIFLPLFDRIATESTIVFTATPGYLADESLADALREHHKSIIWLRLGLEDQDPATLLLSLIESARRLNPAIGVRTLERMKLTPGPVMGWPGLYDLFARELADGLPAASAIVLEYVHLLKPSQYTIWLLTNHLLARLPASLSQILITAQTLALSGLPSQPDQYGDLDLKMDSKDAPAMAAACRVDLSEECLHKAAELVDGRSVVFAGILEACQDLGASFIQGAILHAKNASQLMTTIIRARLESASSDEVRALLLALHLDYCHPELSKAVLGRPVMPGGPWMQPLSDHWSRLRRIWQAPVYNSLKEKHHVAKETSLIPIVEYLAGQGAVEKAVDLCFSKNNYPTAARLMTNAAQKMMDLGQWFTLEGWLKKLPEEVLQTAPRLLYTRGEIAAARGRIADARRSFAASTRLFLEHSKFEGACQSLLAESALAAWEGDKISARRYAQNAQRHAWQVGLSDLLSYANWQLANMSAASDSLEEALVYLRQGAVNPTLPALAELFRGASDRIRRQIDLQEQRRTLYQSYLQTAQEAQDHLVSLQMQMSSPLAIRSELFSQHGWSNTPLNLKMPAPLPSQENLEWQTRPGFLQRLMQAFALTKPEDLPSGADEFINLSLEASPTEELTPQPQQPARPEQLSMPSTDERPAPPSETAIFLPPEPSVAEIPPAPEPELPAVEIAPTPQPELPATEVPPAPQPGLIPSPLDETPHIDRSARIDRKSKQPPPSLITYCLGSFRVFQENKEIVEWSSFKARDILKYFMAQPEKPVAKDILIDVFWPDADPRVGRRNLHQAIYSLRQTMRGDQPEFHHIWFENDAYFLNPRMDIWLDYQEFEKCARNGRRLEKAEHLEEAIQQDAMAEQLYQGDFLEEDIYEDWPSLQREQLLNTYLDVAERLSRLYLSAHQYAAVVPVCQKVLTKDRTHEAAHRLLMQCYFAQGLRHLAVRQYQACLRVLREELGISPAEETAALYEQIVFQGR